VGESEAPSAEYVVSHVCIFPKRCRRLALCCHTLSGGAGAGAQQQGDTLLMQDGQPLEYDANVASTYMADAGDEHGTVKIWVSVGDGPGGGFAWGCDLSYDYVKINAEYST